MNSKCLFKISFSDKFEANQESQLNFSHQLLESSTPALNKCSYIIFQVLFTLLIQIFIIISEKTTNERTLLVIQTNKIELMLVYQENYFDEISEIEELFIDRSIGFSILHKNWEQ
ncbi:hypothetical protein ABPG72_001349 [Tetrahymena utriculariae]